MVQFAALLKEYRCKVTSANEAKGRLAEAKAALEKLYLSHSNLQYELQHLEREIFKCESQDTIFQSIDICSIDDFISNAPEELKMDDLPHQIMLSRMEFELRERKCMIGIVDEIKTEKNTLISTMSKKQTELDELDKELSAILSGTFKLQEKLGIEITKKRDINEKARKLSAPLFSLYRHLSAYYKDDSCHMSEILKEEAGWSVALLIRNETIDIAKITFSYLENMGSVFLSVQMLESAGITFIPPTYLVSRLLDGDDSSKLPRIIHSMEEYWRLI